jgi:hypothetical protein
VFKEGDLADVFLRHLRAPFAPAKAPETRAAKPPRRRIFLTEHEIKKALTQGTSRLTIPKDAIVSPLAQDWLALKGIAVHRLEE